MNEERTTRCHANPQVGMIIGWRPLFFFLILFARVIRGVVDLVEHAVIAEWSWWTEESGSSVAGRAGHKGAGILLMKGHAHLRPSHSLEHANRVNFDSKNCSMNMPLPDNFTVQEVKDAVAELKACFDDARRRADRGDLESEHIQRLAYILKENSVVAEMLKGLPKVSLYKNDVGRSIRDYDFPIEPKARLSKQIATLIEISEDGEKLTDFKDRCFSWYSRLDFSKDFFFPFVRDLTQYVVSQQNDFLERKKLIKKEPIRAPKNYMLDLFISHSSKDKQLAERLIEFVRTALAIPSDRVRCTSVDGYKLTGGAKTDSVLPLEIRGSHCFIGLITPDSLQSQFVLFELGARWGSGQHLIPVLGGGITGGALRAPLSNLNALNSASKNEMEQLIRDLAEVLKKQMPLPATYQKQLHALLKVRPAKKPQPPDVVHDRSQKAIKAPKNTQVVKLAIERVYYQRDVSKGYLCRVAVRNTSEDVAENVHVRINGEVLGNVYAEGYSPFNEPDLHPASGSRSINPGSIADWIFPDSFNWLLDYLDSTPNVLKVNYGIETKEPNQTFAIEVSAKSSPPIVAQFEILKDPKTGKPIIRKMLSNAVIAEAPLPSMETNT